LAVYRIEKKEQVFLKRFNSDVNRFDSQRQSVIDDAKRNENGPREKIRCRLTMLDKFGGLKEKLIDELPADSVVAQSNTDASVDSLKEKNQNSIRINSSEG
jgi:hypothetical protein